MVNREARKEAVRRVTEGIASQAVSINRVVQARYGVPGAYSDSELKQVFESLQSIDKRLRAIRGKL